MIPVKDNISLYMVSEGYSINQLAKESEIKKERISLILTNEEASDAELKKIAATLNVSITELLRGTGRTIKETEKIENNKPTDLNPDLIKEIKNIYTNLESWVKIKYGQYIINKLEANGFTNKDYSNAMNMCKTSARMYKSGHHAMTAKALEGLLLTYTLNGTLSTEHQLDKIKRYMALDNLYTYCDLNDITASSFLQKNQLNYFGSYRRDGIPAYLIGPLAKALNVDVNTLTTTKIYFTNKTAEIPENPKQKTTFCENAEVKTPIDNNKTEEIHNKEETSMSTDNNTTENSTDNNIKIELENIQNSKYEKILKAIKSKPEIESMFLNETYKEIQELYFQKSEEFFWNHYDEIVNI